MNIRGKYWDERIETMPLDRLRWVQEEKFRQQWHYVMASSSFYQRKFGDAGIEPGDIRSLDDLKRLPFTTKQELRDSQSERPPFGLHLAAPVNRVVRVHTTSGTTGLPVVLPLTKHDLAVWNECGGRMFWSMGIRPGDVVMNAFAMSLFTAGLSGCTVLENLGAAVVPVGAEAGTERILRLMQLIKPAALLCTPSFAEYLMESAPRILGTNIDGLGLRRVVVAGEPGGGIPSVKEKIENGYGAELHDWAGIGDVCIYIWGTCSYREGMHYMAQEYVFFELIDPESGEGITLKENGEFEGELVYTHLDREAGPLIRYRSGDNVIVTTKRCECGRTGPRVRYKGRTDDMLIVKGVNVFPSAVKEVVASFVPETTGEIRICVPASDVLPRVTPPLRIKVEYGPGVQESQVEELRDKISSAIKSRLFFTPEVIMVPPGSLERFVMKAKLIERI